MSEAFKPVYRTTATNKFSGTVCLYSGLIWRPTWGHLRELHAAVKLSSEPLLFGRYSNFSLGQEQEVKDYTASYYSTLFNKF